MIENRTADAVSACLEERMIPADIISLEERPFFRFKTARINMMKEYLK